MGPVRERERDASVNLKRISNRVQHIRRLLDQIRTTHSSLLNRQPPLRHARSQNDRNPLPTPLFFFPRPNGTAAPHTQRKATRAYARRRQLVEGLTEILVRLGVGHQVLWSRATCGMKENKSRVVVCRISDWRTLSMGRPHQRFSAAQKPAINPKGGRHDNQRQEPNL